MDTTFIEKNIVILGNFKPSRYDKLYFIKNDLIKEFDFLDNSMFMSEISIIETSNFVINVTQQQIVISAKNPSKETTIQNIASLIINDENIYINAIGFNFKWFMFVDNYLNDFTKKLFYTPNNTVINKHFNTDDTLFGYYVSKNYEYSRLKLDIKPLLVHQVDTNVKRNVLNFDFNFHIERSSYSNVELSKLLLDYNRFENEAKLILAEHEL
jgi:hypothetical protein